MSGSLVVLEPGARDSNGYRWIELKAFCGSYISTTNRKLSHPIPSWDFGYSFTRKFKRGLPSAGWAFAAKLSMAALKFWIM